MRQPGGLLLKLLHRADRSRRACKHRGVVLANRGSVVQRLLHRRRHGSGRGAAALAICQAEGEVRSPAPGTSTRPVVRGAARWSRHAWVLSAQSRPQCSISTVLNAEGAFRWVSAGDCRSGVRETSGWPRIDREQRCAEAVGERRGRLTMRAFEARPPLPAFSKRGLLIRANPARGEVRRAASRRERVRRSRHVRRHRYLASATRSGSV